MKLTHLIALLFFLSFSAEAGTWIETFDDGNLEAWNELIQLNNKPGSWKIVNGELHAVSPDGWTRLLTISNETWDDYTIEFDVKPLKMLGVGNITIAARIKGDWAVWCFIGDHPFPKNISVAVCAAGNFRVPAPLYFFGVKSHQPLGLKQWSKLKLGVEGNILNFWINGKQALGPIVLPNRETFERHEAVRKQHHEQHHADDENLQFRPMRLDGFQDFLTGSVGFGLANYTARFDNITVTGDGIPNRGGLAVTSKGKLATIWGNLKRF